MGAFSSFSLLSGLIALFFVVFLFLWYLYVILSICGDFEYLWVSWIVVFISVYFLQVRVFRSYICLVEIEYLSVWVSGLSDSSCLCFVLNRYTSFLSGVCIDFARIMVLCSRSCIKLSPLA